MIARNLDRPERRHRQLERVLLVAELLSPLRLGATVRELAEDVCDSLGEPYCPRTIRRDLEALEAFGLVERVDVPGASCCFGGEQYRWRWLAGSRRASACEAMAATVAARRDPFPMEVAS